MAQKDANTFSSYDANANKEDISAIIANIDPTATPFLTMIGRDDATQRVHQWLTEGLDAASGSNFVIEGDVVSIDAANNTTSVNNVCGISDKAVSVTGSQAATLRHGVSREMAHQMELKSKALKRDVETILLANNAKVTGNDTTARQVGGLQTYVTTNTNVAADATAATGDGSDVHTDGTARALQESFVEDALQQAWTAGGEPSIGILGQFQKRKFATFSGSSTKQIDGNTAKVVNSVDIYIDPLGTEIRLVPDRFVPADVIYFVDPDMAEFVTLRDFMQKEVSRTHDSEERQLLVEATLKVNNEAAHAGVYDLTTS